MGPSSDPYRAFQSLLVSSERVFLRMPVSVSLRLVIIIIGKNVIIDREMKLLMCNADPQR